eukprot:1208751-Pleurochrysis_carterae.AAC.1
MHSLPFCNRIACVLAERSRSYPQALGTRSRWPPLPSERPFPRAARRCAQPPRLRPLPDR